MLRMTRIRDCTFIQTYEGERRRVYLHTPSPRTVILYGYGGQHRGNTVAWSPPRPCICMQRSLQLGARRARPGPRGDNYVTQSRAKTPCFMSLKGAPGCTAPMPCSPYCSRLYLAFHSWLGVRLRVLVQPPLTSSPI
eukprot:scaffold31620_cov73-Phaeocystis_antarctica.AAC.2